MLHVGRPRVNMPMRRHAVARAGLHKLSTPERIKER
jgi:hypothetical protein